MIADVERFRVLMVTVQTDLDGTYEACALIDGRIVARSNGWATRSAAFADGTLSVVAADDDMRRGDR